MVRRTLAKFGWTLMRTPNPGSIAQEQALRLLWLAGRGIHTVLDVGANTGQFARAAHAALPGCGIYCFKSLPDCSAEIEPSMSPGARVRGFNLALGDAEGEKVMHRSEFSPSSSLLPMAELHKSAFPFTRNSTTQTVRVARLDDVVRELGLELTPPLLVKLDVQGSENRVIDGGGDTLRGADVVIVELSVESLYENQPGFHDVYTRLVDLGFTYRGNLEQLLHPENGRVLQMDGVFIRSAEPAHN